MKRYETVIGLEVHVELATKTKIFCGCSTEFGGPPNSHTCPVCMAMPGTLPVLNKQVVEYAIAVGLATNCAIASKCRFDRKNYFYPDNPQNYQISQLYQPICRNGYVEIDTEDDKKKIGICEIHMEEDAGKLIHNGEGNTLIDYNRAGVPLIEIVSEPDMRSDKEVIAYLEKLRLIIQYLGASDCKLNEGSMRADVNVSIREIGSKEFGTRTEMKNLNSFRSITRAIENERERQIAILESGGQVVQETRRWDEAQNKSYSMRSKEDAKDYRYFPEPDLVELIISESWVNDIKSKEPELREAKVQRYISEMKLPEYDAMVITENIFFADLFEEIVECGSSPKKASNWIMGETMRLCREKNVSPENIKVSAQNLSKLISLVESKEINITVAKEIFEKMFEKDFDPVVFVEEHNMKQDSDEDSLKEVIAQVIENNPKIVSDIKNGKVQAIGALVGQTMKFTKGKANPELVNKILREMF